jgi:hypothetical protein
VGILSSDNPNLGASSVLGIADGELTADLHSRLDLALQYIANWYKATKGSDNQDVWWTQIDQVRAKVDDVFPSSSEVAMYNDASASYAALYTQLYASYDTLPQPALIDQAADLATTIVQTPSYVITWLAGLVGKTVNDAAKNLFLEAWPVLLVAGAAGVLYLFRRPLSRLTGAL